MRSPAALVSALVGLALVFSAAAQDSQVPSQPLNSPNYLLSLLDARALVDGKTLPGELTATDGQNFKDGSYLDVWGFRGRAGDVVEIALDSPDFDAYLVLYGPDGELIELNDDAPTGFSTDAQLSAALPETGRYLVIATTFSAGQLGSYQISLRLLSAAAAADAEPAALELPASQIGSLVEARPTPEGRSEVRYAFTLDADALLFTEVRSLEFDTVLSVYDADGNLIERNDDGGSTLGTDSRLALPLGPGRYLLGVSSFGGEVLTAATFELTATVYLPAP